MRILLLVLLSYTLALAETKQEQGKRIIDEAIAALGGDRFLAMKNRAEQGRAYSFYREELSGLSRATIYTRYLTAAVPPAVDKLYLRERQAFGKEEVWAVLFNETGAWEVTYRGARPLREDRIERYRDTRQRDIFYILLRRLGEKGLLIESRGTEVVDNRPVQIVDITDSENRVVTVYFHYSTKLPIRQVFYRRDPKTKFRHEEVTFYDKYRDVGDGVLWPFVVQTRRDGERVYSMFSETVSINEPLTDEKFTLPVNIKMLPREK